MQKGCICITGTKILQMKDLDMSVSKQHQVV